MTDQLPDVPPPTGDMVVPVTGEIVRAEDTEKVMALLLQLREWQKEELQPFIAALEQAVLAHAMDVRAEYTLRLGGLVASSVSAAAAHSYQYDGDKLRKRLWAAGLPKEQIEQAIVREVSYRVNGARIRSLANHPVYGPIVEECRSEVPKRRSVSVKRDV